MQQIGVAMATPAGKPSLEFRSLRLSKDDPGDALLEPGAVVDEFGQWIHDDWPGKARNLEELEDRVGGRGEGARRGRVAVLPLRRLQGYEGQGDRLLPRGEDRGQVVVRRSGRASVPLGGRGLDRRGRDDAGARDAKSLFAALPPGTGGARRRFVLRVEYAAAVWRRTGRRSGST